MNIKKIIILLWLACAVWHARPIFAFEVIDYQNYVTDAADIYSSEFEQELNNQISTFEKETGAEIAVVTINKLSEASIEEYAVRVVEKWSIGKMDEDNGVLVLIAKDDRQVKIEIGYGLEAKITDSMAGRIIRDEMTPQFKLENYEQGTLVAVEKIMGYIKGEVVEQVGSVEPFNASGFVENIKVLILGSLFLIYMASFLGRSKEIITGAIVGFLVGVIFANIAIGVVLGILGLVFDFVLSRNFKKYTKRGYPTGFWKSRGGFGRIGSGNGGGFKGFGGGGSGGGGASGKW